MESAHPITSKINTEVEKNKCNISTLAWHCCTVSGPGQLAETDGAMNITLRQKTLKKNS